MSRLVLATDDAAFETRVRSAFDGEFNGDLRYWREGFLRGDPSRAVTELLQNGAEVVALGPGLPSDSALELAREHRLELRQSEAFAPLFVRARPVQNGGHEPA